MLFVGLVLALLASAMYLRTGARQLRARAAP